jgi:two-component system nitrate/nitrite response regulator NarL
VPTKPEAVATDRELEVLELVADGLSIGQISTRLSISTRTVKYHLDALRDKLGARDRTHLMAVAFRTGLLDEGLSK